MSSSAPDDYVGLMTPWKPIADFALKNVTSVHDRIEIDHGIKVSNLACIKHDRIELRLTWYRMET